MVSSLTGKTSYTCRRLLVDGACSRRPPKRPTAVVVEVAGLKAPDGASARDYGLTLEQLRDPRSLLTVRPLS